MKYLLLVLSLAFSLQSFGQDSQLFENDWYLQKVIIDDKDHFPPNSNTEPVIEKIQFDETEDLMHISHCDAVAPMINYDPVENLFTLEDDPIVLIGDCIEPENIVFSAAHFTIYYEPTAHLAKNPFSYSIDPGGNGTLILTIENPDGNQAIYGNELLSNQTLDTSSFKLYPNPVSDVLTVFSPNSEVLSIEVYSIRGKKVSSFKNSRGPIKEIDLINLDSGIYLMKIYTQAGTAVKKIIKK